MNGVNVAVHDAVDRAVRYAVSGAVHDIIKEIE